MLRAIGNTGILCLLSPKGTSFGARLAGVSEAELEATYIANLQFAADRFATTGATSLVEVRPLTGRTHQVRVHLAHLGSPVAGDTLYGGSGTVPRPFLHAWRLSLPHPADARSLELCSPVPADMAAMAHTLGLGSPVID